jgi:hypothetical protein
MSYRKWLLTTLFFILFFALGLIAVNFYVDHHAVRLSLFSLNKEIHQTIYPDGINQHMFNPEVIFRQPKKFDSFLFGSSRISSINVANIPAGRFYNMSYSQGLPAQHLAIIKAFLQRGVKIKSVVIGLDEFCFSLSASAHQKQLLRIMHPDIGGPGRSEIFGMYFFRKPSLNELARWKDRVLCGQMDGRIIINSQGVHLGWSQKEKILLATEKPIFQFNIQKYEPITYGKEETDEAFVAIEELINLSHAQGFSVTFFITPFYANFYLNYAEGLLSIKERLANLTNYYDFSGINSVTIDELNYYEESHYRYRVGDMIIARIFGSGAVKLPNDFGLLVTRQNVGQHLKDQQQELSQYLRKHNLR